MLTLVVGACTPETPPATPAGVSTTPTAAPTASASSKPEVARPDPYTPQGPFAEEKFATVDTAPLAAPLKLDKAPAAVGKAPAVCDEYVKNKATAAPACGDRAAALSALDKALALATPGAEAARRPRRTR